MGGEQWQKKIEEKQENKEDLEELTCSSAGAAAAAGEGAVIAVEASAFLLFASIFVKAFEGTGAPDGFSFDASGPELTDLVDPVFGFFTGGGAISPSSSLKDKKNYYYRHKKDINRTFE